MDLIKYSKRRELERLPTKFFLRTGCGESDITIHAGSFHMALAECGIEDCNVMTYSSILPADCVEVTEEVELTRGAVLDTITARCDGGKGDLISAGIIVGDLIKKTNKKKCGSLVCEIGDKISEEEVEQQLTSAINELFENGYKEEFTLENLRTKIKSCKVKKKFGTALVVIGFTEHQHIFAPPELKPTHFLEIQKPYKTADYVFYPVCYDGYATYSRGSKVAPVAILDASTHLERYDIETDCQPHTITNLHTLEPVWLQDDPIIMIETVQNRIAKLLEDNKFPITIAGGHGVSIGAFRAFKDLGENFTILQLDAHTDLRNSYDGTPYSEACVMARAKECTDNIVQVGIRSISNTERSILDFDKLFLAQDIKNSDDLWIDDVIEECTDNVYITFDVDVLDPSIVSTPTPEPDGLYYEHILKLFRKLLKTKNVIGLDVNNFLPVPGNCSPEFTVAKLILQFIAFREKFGK